MTVASAEEEIRDFDFRCSASTVRFNLVEFPTGGYRRSSVVLLSRDGQGYNIGKRSFSLLKEIVTRPTADKTMATARRVSASTIKNEITQLSKKFGVENNSHLPGVKLKLIDKLLTLGVIAYEPSITDNQIKIK